MSNKILPFSQFRVSTLILICVSGLSYGQYTSNGSGPWSSPATWSPVPGGVPPTSATVTIRSIDSVWVDAPTAALSDITVNGILATVNLPSSTLSTDGNISVNANAKLYNHGSIDLSAPRSFVLGANATYVHNPRNDAEVKIFTNGIESFASTSNLFIYKWDDENVPLGESTRVATSIFGNLTLAFPSATVWEQRGRFAPSRIQGSFTVSAGTISMDDGTGVASTTLNLQSVTVSGTGSIIFQKGINRNLTLTTGSFTDNSTGVDTTMVMYQSFGTLLWTVNGNFTTSHPFVGIYGTLSEGANGRIIVNGNLSINGSSFEFCKQVNAPSQINVSGITTISGNPSRIRFLDGNTGDMTFTTGDFIVSGGNNIVLSGGNPAIPASTGAATVVVSNDFVINGTTSITVLDGPTSVKKVRVAVGRDYINSISGSSLKLANSAGAVTFFVSRHINITGGNFTGQENNASAGIDSVFAGGNFIFNSATPTNFFRANQGTGNTFLNVTGNVSLINSGTAVGQGISMIHIPATMNMGAGALAVNIGGTYTQNGGRFNGIYRGSGLCTFNCMAGNFTITGGVFSGIHNTDTITSGNGVFNFQNLSFSGGTFIAHNGNTNAAVTSNVTITGNCDINFSAASDQFKFIGLPLVSPSINSLALNLNINGNLNIGGAAGSFVSSHSQGIETINVSGNMNLSGGVNSFNVFPNSGFQTNGHTVNLTVNGQVTVTGGTTYLSAELGTLNGSFNQDLIISNGTLAVKGGYGSAIVNVARHYNQTGGNFEFYKNTTAFSNLVVAVYMNSDGDNIGDFTHTGGVISFSDNINSSSAENILVIKNPNYTIGGTGLITNASAGVSTRLGIIDFNRAGSINFTRVPGSSHNISQARNIIEVGCTVDVISGNVQIASHTLNTVLDLLKINANGVLFLRNNSQVYSNGTYPFSHIQTFNFSRIKIQHPNGFFNGTANAAINASNGMNFSLATGAAVEYNGTVNQPITGLGYGIATLPQHKYGILDINMAPGTYAYPADNNVFVKYQLVLTQGVLNLDPDDNPLTLPGRPITVEGLSTLSITRSNGYIKSETQDGSAVLRWFMGSNPGTRTVPFGYNALYPYIPLKYTFSSGTADTVTFATFHTNVANLPYPPTVTHVRNLSGVDNSVETVDRFWLINTKGSAASVNYEFNYASNEDDLLSGQPRAQKWDAPTLAWSFPFPGVQSNIVDGVVANSITNKSGWWTLAAITSPLPVDLVDFSAQCDNGIMKLQWSTSSETNNNFFRIERSSDGRNYSEISKTEGAGNSSSLTTYSVIDGKPLKGRNFYRISQTDFNGNTEILKTISINSCYVPGIVHVSVLNNDFTSVLINASSENIFSISINDMQGRRLISKMNQKINAGFNVIDFDTRKLSKGLYNIVVYNSEEKYHIKSFLGR